MKACYVAWSTTSALDLRKLGLLYMYLKNLIYFNTRWRDSCISIKSIKAKYIDKVDAGSILVLALRFREILLLEQPAT